MITSMTAEIAVMNPQGVAIAADSAVTIGKKTYYTAQKVFSLSKAHAVGIMIYSSSTFMDIDWEILINEFSKDRGDRFLPTLKEYVEYFITFLKDFPHITDERQKKYLGFLSYTFFDTIKDRYNDDVAENYQDQEITKAQQTRILAGILKKIREQLEKEEWSTNFTDDGFVKDNRAIIEDRMKKALSDFAVKDKMKEEMVELFLLDLVKAEIAWGWNEYSGIVFAGYGDKELFPSIVEYRMYGKLGKNVLHMLLGEGDIKDSDDAWIAPFSQTKTIRSFIMGIHPDFKDKISEELEKLTGEILDITGKKYTEEINKLKDGLKQRIDDYETDTFRSPVFDIVNSLPTSNLAEMAEALINLTALRQTVSTEEQSVGGPTDVALITKADGFVWIKKKQLFQSAG